MQIADQRTIYSFDLYLFVNFEEGAPEKGAFASRNPFFFAFVTPFSSDLHNFTVLFLSPVRILELQKRFLYFDGVKNKGVELSVLIGSSFLFPFLITKKEQKSSSFLLFFQFDSLRFAN